jgi:hypothetical protein
MRMEPVAGDRDTAASEFRAPHFSGTRSDRPRCSCGDAGPIERALPIFGAKSGRASGLHGRSESLAVFGAATMRQAFNQLVEFLHQGIAAIFRFVQLLWTWSVDQISALLAVPWQQWPLWKQFLLVLVLAGVIWALFRVARELFEAGVRILSAFASLLGVLVHTLPSVALAGVIALGGVWLMNHLDNKPIQLPVAYNPFASSPPPPAGNPAPASANSNPAPASGPASPAPAASSTPAPAAEPSSSANRPERSPEK